MHQPRGTTGPTTEAGKQIASRNAAKHNCTATSLIVAGESQADFDALHESLVAEYLPETEMQRTRVHEAARATWELRRAHREFDKSQVRLYQQQPNMCEWNPTQQAELTRMSRYRTRAERTYHRALQSVECLRAMRLRAEQRVFWENLQTARLDLSERRHDLSVERHEFTVERHKLTVAARKTKPEMGTKQDLSPKEEPNRNQEPATNQETHRDERMKRHATRKAIAPNQKKSAHQAAVQKQSPQQPLDWNRWQAALAKGADLDLETENFYIEQGVPISPILQLRTPDQFLAYVSNFMDEYEANQEKQTATNDPQPDPPA